MTSANIFIHLRDADIKKTHRTAWGTPLNPKGNHYLRIYVHGDGYPDGVGKDLLEMNMTYEQALEFILEGDRSAISRSYYEWRGETCAPVPVDDPICEENYMYVLEEVYDGEPLVIFCEDRSGNEYEIR